DKADEGTVYQALAPTSRARFVIARTSANPSALVAPLRQVVRDLDPNLPFSSVATLDELVERSLVRPRSLSMLVSAAAAVALVLSIGGIYGVMAYYVQQHAKDIGIRLALGGSRGELIRLLVGQSMTVVYGVTAARLLSG